LAEPIASRVYPNCLNPETQLRCGTQELFIGGDQHTSLRITGCQGPRCGQLQGIGGLKRELREESLSLDPKRFVRLQLPPNLPELFKAEPRCGVLNDRQLSGPQQTLERAAHLDGSRPPNGDLILLKKTADGGTRFLSDT
jgi:hypothetical protein